MSNLEIFNIIFLINIFVKIIKDITITNILINNIAEIHTKSSKHSNITVYLYQKYNDKI